MIIPPTSKSEASGSGDGGAGAGAGASGSRGYRLKRGTKLSDVPPIPPAPAVPPLSALNGPFQLAEYLALLVRHDPHDIRALVEVPSGDGSVGGKAPEKDVWIYEHLRRIPVDLTPLITALLPICNRETCPQMKADEWLYLCVAHGGGQTEECCAIDYILHTLDSTTALLNSSKNFPSRLSIPSASLTHFPSLFRRLSRIFSHAYFQHREAFSLAEAETSLYARFVALCERFELVGPGLLVIPRDAVGHYSKGKDDKARGLAPNVNGAEETEEEDEFNRGPRGAAKIDSRQKDTSSSPSKSRTTASVGGTIRDQPRASGGMTIGRGTLGRGKQPRATMLWTAAADTPSLPENSIGSKDDADVGDQAGDEVDIPQGFRNRSESIQSIVHVPPEINNVHSSDQEEADELTVAEVEEPGLSIDDESQADLAAEVEDLPSPLPDAEAEEVEEGSAASQNADEEEDVPKDEIELLEEEGKLDPEPPVAPLSPNSEKTRDIQEGEGDELEEVELNEGEVETVSAKAEEVVLPQEKGLLPSTPSKEQGSDDISETTSSPLGKSKQNVSTISPSKADANKGDDVKSENEAVSAV